MKLSKGLCLLAPAALLATTVAFAQAPKIMDTPPGIPVYKDRIVGGEPRMGAVNGTTSHPIR